MSPPELGAPRRRGVGLPLDTAPHEAVPHLDIPGRRVPVAAHRLVHAEEQPEPAALARAAGKELRAALEELHGILAELGEEVEE